MVTPPARPRGTIGHLLGRLDFRQQPGDQRVPRFVIGGLLLGLLGQDLLALGAHQHAVGGLLEVVPLDALLVLARGQDRRLVGQVAQVGPGHADHLAGDLFEVDVVGQRLVARVHLENLQPALPGGPIDGDVPVESARPQQGRVEHVGPIGGGDDDDRLRWA